MNDIDTFELRQALGWPQRCSEEVTRRGIAQPCDRIAAAIREDRANGGYYSVCTRHTRAPMVPLESIVKFMLDRHEAQTIIAAGLVQMAFESPKGTQ